MSVKSWLAEFYPTDANVAAELSALEAVEHSLTKWKGLRKENLGKHGLNKPPITINDETCALCVKFLNDYCKECPLYLSLDKTARDTSTSEEFISPFASYTFNKNPEPMITALEKAKPFAQ